MNVGGQTVTNPFPNNSIPSSMWDPVALKIQNLIALPFCVAGPPCNATGVVNNYQNSEAVARNTEAPSLKLDQIVDFNLYMIKAILNGRGDEIVDLAKTNLIGPVRESLARCSSSVVKPASTVTRA